MLLFSWSEHILENIRIPVHGLQEGRMICVSGDIGAKKESVLDHLYQQMTLHTKSQCGFMRDDIQRHPLLTVYDTLYYYMNLHHVHTSCKMKDALSHILSVFHLSDVQSKQAEDLTRGEWKRVMCAYHFLRNDNVLFLDNLLAGIEPQYIDILLTVLRSSGKTIIITINQDLGRFVEYFDEVWDVCVLSHHPSPSFLLNYHSIITGQTDMVDIDLASDDSGVVVSGEDEPRRRTFLGQVLLLIRREMQISIRDYKTTLIRFLAPIVLICVQGALIGFLFHNYRKWETNGALLSWFSVVVEIYIILLTVSIIPIHMFYDFMEKYKIIRHEYTSGLFSHNAYHIAAMIIDQTYFTCMGTIIGALHTLTTPLFPVVSGAIIQCMLHMNLLGWVCFLCISSSYTTIFRIMMSYISFSILSIHGFLFRYNILSFIRYMNMTFLQTMLIIQKIQSVSQPIASSQIQMISQWIDPHHIVISQSELYGISIGMILFLPCLMFVCVCVRYTMNIVYRG